jgi:hypothetical protein
VAGFSRELLLLLRGPRVRDDLSAGHCRSLRLVSMRRTRILGPVIRSAGSSDRKASRSVGDRPRESRETEKLTASRIKKFPKSRPLQALRQAEDFDRFYFNLVKVH